MPSQKQFMNPTLQAYNQIFEQCKALFFKKNADYGTAWQILRPSSLTDQIFIKAQRIRTLETLKTQKIDDNIENEYIGIINYSIMSLIQCKAYYTQPVEVILQIPTPLNATQLSELYHLYQHNACQLMQQKNHDYGEAWRSMRVSSFTDLILMKLLRIKQIEDNEGKTIVSEGIEANFYDIINYAIFALIKIQNL